MTPEQIQKSLEATLAPRPFCFSREKIKTRPQAEKDAKTPLTKGQAGYKIIYCINMDRCLQEAFDKV